jgi:hypothetical protein
VPNLAQADSQATTLPPTLTASTLGQSTGLVQPAGTHPSRLILSLVPPLAMLMYIGRLDPSTMLTS